MEKESKEQREGVRDDRGKKCGVRRKVEEKTEGDIQSERQELNKFNWRPCFKQRGLFSDRDPSQEIELEKRLIGSVQVAL